MKKEIENMNKTIRISVHFNLLEIINADIKHC